MPVSSNEDLGSMSKSALLELRRDLAYEVDELLTQINTVDEYIRRVVRIENSRKKIRDDEVAKWVLENVKVGDFVKMDTAGRCKYREVMAITGDSIHARETRYANPMPKRSSHKERVAIYVNLLGDTEMYYAKKVLGVARRVVDDVYDIVSIRKEILKEE